MRGQKLPDGKNVGGAGRLTDDVIDRIQSDYGEAIRNNSEIGTMKTAISGVYRHMIKDDKMTLVQKHKHFGRISCTIMASIRNHVITSSVCSELKYLFDRLCDERCFKDV